MTIYHYTDPQAFRECQDRLAGLYPYLQLLCEQHNRKEAEQFLAEIREFLTEKEKEMQKVEPEPILRSKEPDDYETIVKLSEGGNVPAKEIKNLKKRMLGALIGRFAGCMLGVPVESWPIEGMKVLAKEGGMAFPPVDYWTKVNRPDDSHYGADLNLNYSKSGINGVAVDDDIMYTLIGYLILKQHGLSFTTEDVGAFWKEQLPLAFTTEEVALKHLHLGVPAGHCAEENNPWVQLIGADIRADAFGYAAAGDPHLAAWLGYKDAYLSHRRNGIYGEMYFAAAEAAAFTVDDPMEALKIAMKEIPAECLLYRDLSWAFDNLVNVKTYEDAARLVAERFAGMNPVHTNNNACLTVFGIHLGKGDYTASISNTVAMGLDNDCTTATVGSIVGATVGIDGIPGYWYENFHDEVRGYLKDYKRFSISEVAADLALMVEDRLAKSE